MAKGALSLCSKLKSELETAKTTVSKQEDELQRLRRARTLTPTVTPSPKKESESAHSSKSTMVFHFRVYIFIKSIFINFFRRNSKRKTLYSSASVLVCVFLYLFTSMGFILFRQYFKRVTYVAQ